MVCEDESFKRPWLRNYGQRTTSTVAYLREWLVFEIEESIEDSRPWQESYHVSL